MRATGMVIEDEVRDRGSVPYFLRILPYRITRAGDPDTNVTSSTFGQALFQGSPGGSFGQQGATFGTGNAGRQMELGLKIIF